MTFGYWPGLLALSAVGPLLVAYFLRRKQKPRVVSALFLWQIPSQRAEGGPRLRRFSREMSLLLEIAAVLAASLFLADLHLGKGALRKHTVVVLDGSLSMRATFADETAADRAVREIGRAASEEGAEVLTVVESGPHPKVLAGPAADVSKALASLSSWRPSQPAHDFAHALMLARELATSKGQRIRLVTDGPPEGDPAWPEEVEVRSVGEPADNVAFLSAQRRDEGGIAHVSLRVANFGKHERAVSVLVSNGEANRRESLELGAGASAMVRFELKTAAPLSASLPPDALSLDGELVLPPVPLEEVAVAMQPGLDAAAQSALKRFFAVAPGARLSTEPVLTWGPPGAAAGVTLGAKGHLHSYVGPFFAEKSDALLDDVRMEGVVWTAGDRPPGRPLISMGDTVMMSVDDGHLHLNVDLSRSNVQRTAAWPVLLANVIRDARLRLPGFSRKILMLGEEADVVIDSRGRCQLESPSGVKRPLFGGGATRLPVEEAGEWKMTKDGQLLDTLFVLPLDSRESDLSTRGKYEVHARSFAGFAASAAEAPRPRWLLALLLVLLLVDFRDDSVASDRSSPSLFPNR